MSFGIRLFNKKEYRNKESDRMDEDVILEEDIKEDDKYDIVIEHFKNEDNIKKEEPVEEHGEYEVVEREILPEKIICPDCGGITLAGLDFCDKCGGEL